MPLKWSCLPAGRLRKKGNKELEHQEPKEEYRILLVAIKGYNEQGMCAKVTSSYSKVLIHVMLQSPRLVYEKRRLKDTFNVVVEHNNLAEKW